MASKQALTAEQTKALTALANDALTLSEAEHSLNERDFDQRVALYVKASVAMWKAVNVFGGDDADKAGSKSIGMVQAALKAQGKEWKPSDSQLSRFRTLRNDTVNRRNSYKVWVIDQGRTAQVGDYVSFIGAIVRGDRNEDGSLTEAGKKKQNASTRAKNTRAKAVLHTPDTFDVTTLFGASATKAEKAAEIMALIHDLNRELSALKLSETDKKAARSSLSKKIEAATAKK